MHVSFRKSVAVRLNSKTGLFEEVSLDQLHWSITDVGTMYGAILVERLRTYGGRLVDVDDHRLRIFTAAKLFGINMENIEPQFETVCGRLVSQNSELLHREGDFGVVFLLSPGELESGPSGFGGNPTCMAHLMPLPFSRLAGWYSNGTALMQGTRSTVPNQCWPSTIKTRSRLPYLLSDVDVLQSNSNALTVLTTLDGYIADTAVANLLVVKDQAIYSPVRDDILVGCTLQSMERLLQRDGGKIIYQDLTPDNLTNADEVILTGTSGGVWFANSFNGMPVGTGGPGPTLARLTRLWTEHVGLDFVHQASHKT